MTKYVFGHGAITSIIFCIIINLLKKYEEVFSKHLNTTFLLANKKTPKEINNISQIFKIDYKHFLLNMFIK